MQVGQIRAFRRAHRADLSPSLDHLAVLDEDLIEVRIHRLNHRAILIPIWQAVGHNDHLAPAGTRHAGVNHTTRSGGKNRVSQVGILPADAIEIIAEVPRDAERPRVVGERPVLRTQRHVKPHRHRQKGDLLRSQPLKRRVERRSASPPQAMDAPPPESRRRGDKKQAENDGGGADEGHAAHHATL